MLIAEAGLIKGERIGVDASTMEANAALRNIVRRDNGEGYREMLERLARESGVETPTAEDLARLERKRKGKKLSNTDWVSKSDPEAKIAKMKDGTTHLAYKPEHAVDLDTGAVVAAELHPADEGDTTTLSKTLAKAEANLEAVDAAPTSEDPAECVADKGYHSRAVLRALNDSPWKTRIAAPKQTGFSRWHGDEAARRAVTNNRARLKSGVAREAFKLRAEIVERCFAHNLDRGGMRRTWLRGRENVHKRYLLHVAGHNLSLLMRQLIGAGTPREAVAGGYGGIFVLLTPTGATPARACRSNPTVPGFLKFEKAVRTDWRRTATRVCEDGSVAADAVRVSAGPGLMGPGPWRRADTPRRRLPQRPMAGLGAGDRVRDLVQHGVPDLLVAALEGVGAADPDHAVPEMAVAEAAPGLDEGKGPVGELVLVHQPPRQGRDGVQPLGAVPCALPFRLAELAVRDGPARVAATHPRSLRVELHDLAALRSAGAGEHHLVTHAPVGAGLVVRREQGSAPRARGFRQRGLRDAPGLVRVVDDLGEPAPALALAEMAVDGLPPVGEADGSADGELAFLSSIGHSMGLLVGWPVAVAGSGPGESSVRWPRSTVNGPGWVRRRPRTWPAPRWPTKPRGPGRGAG